MPSPTGGVMFSSVSFPCRRSSSVSNRGIARTLPLSRSTRNRNSFATNSGRLGARTPAASRERSASATAVPEAGPDAGVERAPVEEVRDRDVGRGKAAVPEEDPLVVALAARLPARDDVRQLAVQRL